METENSYHDSYRVPRFPLIASCYKIADSQTSFIVMLMSRSRESESEILESRSRYQRRKFWKGRSWCRSRTYYLRLRNSR